MNYSEIENEIRNEYYVTTNECGEEIISVEWLTGGVDGGNCWEEGGHYPVSGEPEPQNWDLEEIILKYFRNITFMDYKELYQKHVKYDTDSHNEYYGNYTTYGVKYIKITDFLEYMKEHGYVN